MTVKDVYDVTTDVLFCISRWDEESGDAVFLYDEDTEDYSINMSIPTELLNCEVKGMWVYDSLSVEGRHVMDLSIV